MYKIKPVKVHIGWRVIAERVVLGALTVLVGFFFWSAGVLMDLYINLAQEPCALIDGWKQAAIMSPESDHTVPACWVRVGDTVHFKYWLNGMVYKSEVKVSKQ